MGAVKELITGDETGRYVLYVDRDGWFSWTTASWWDDPAHKGYQTRHERNYIDRYATIDELTTVRDAMNLMQHGTRDWWVYETQRRSK